MPTRRWLQQNLDVQCNLRTVVELVKFDYAANGHFDIAVGASGI